MSTSRAKPHAGGTKKCRHRPWNTTRRTGQKSPSHERAPDSVDGKTYPTAQIQGKKLPNYSIEKLKKGHPWETWQGIPDLVFAMVSKLAHFCEKGKVASMGECYNFWGEFELQMRKLAPNEFLTSKRYNGTLNFEFSSLSNICGIQKLQAWSHSYGRGGYIFRIWKLNYGKIDPLCGVP